jgi:phosphoglycolate phosphatase
MSKPLMSFINQLHLQVNNQIKAVVFDCDGVLFDSKAANVQFYNQILARYDRPLVRPEQEEFIHMHPARESLRYLLGNGSAGEDAWRFCQTLDFRQFNAFLRVEPGLIPFLDAIKPHYHIALATNRTVSTQEVLSHFLLDKYFDLVVTAADVHHPKPHPESMERIFHSLAVTAKETLYIGDSQVDEALAIATEVFFVAYKNQHLQAHFHIDHFQQLHPLLVSASG